MRQVTGHANLVALIGVVTSGAPLLLLLSLCEKGSLLSFVKAAAARQSAVKPGDKLRLAVEIGRGHRPGQDEMATDVVMEGKFLCACRSVDRG